MKYPTTIEGLGMTHLARRVAALRYDALREFLAALGGELCRDASADDQRNRPQLAAQLREARNQLARAGFAINRAWQICRRHMPKEETMTRDSDTSPTPFDTEEDYKKHSTAHLVDHSSPENSKKLAEAVFFRKLTKELSIDPDDDAAHGFAFKGWQRVKAIAPLFASHLLLVSVVVEQMIATGRATINPKYAHEIMLVEMRLRELRPIE